MYLNISKCLPKEGEHDLVPEISVVSTVPVCSRSANSFIPLDGLEFAKELLFAESRFFFFFGLMQFT